MSSSSYNSGSLVYGAPRRYQGRPTAHISNTRGSGSSVGPGSRERFGATTSSMIPNSSVQKNNDNDGKINSTKNVYNDNHNIPTNEHVNTVPKNVDEGEHKLSKTWTLYFMHRCGGLKLTTYVNTTKTLAEFKTVEGFWNVYLHMNRPSDLETITDVQFFKDGIQPMWEDPKNFGGGKWILRLCKVISDRFWEEILLAMIGGTMASTVNGAVMSIRRSENILSVWVSSAATKDDTLHIRDSIKSILGLTEDAILEYKEHQESLRDRSSYRNTEVLQ